MKIADFNYDLPEQLIAHQPATYRDRCRLMVVNRLDQSISTTQFNQLPKILDSNTVLVFNDSRVFPARLLGQKTSGGKVEVLLLQKHTDYWQAICKPGLKPGQVVQFPGIKAEVIGVDQVGKIQLKFEQSSQLLDNVIDQAGRTPLPPYIKATQPEKIIRRQYQTVYAKKQGSAAAPTAGLHFSNHLLQKLAGCGIGLEFLTLHVGLGTFRPVQDEQIQAGKLHQEQYFLDEDTARRLNQAKQAGKKIIAVGTTTTRVLESCAVADGVLRAGNGETQLFIYPPYKFKFIDGLITNFHIPKSSLLMLVTALVSTPQTEHAYSNFTDSLVGQAYHRAIVEKFRFFSFGDAMLIT